MTVFFDRKLIAALVLGWLGAAVQASDYMSPGLTPQQLLELMNAGQAPLVVDVRASVEYGVAHIPGAINIPVPELEGRLEEVKNEKGVLIYCINGSRTRQAEAVLLAADIANVQRLEGTFSAWIDARYPVEKGGVQKSGW